MTHAELLREFIGAIDRLIAATKSIAGTSLEANAHFEKLIAGMRAAQVNEGDAEPQMVEMLTRIRDTAGVVDTLTRGLQGVLDGLIKNPPVVN